jgi:hypothetical protein
LDVFGPTELVHVLRFAQPPPLALSLAGLAAWRLGTELLVEDVPVVWLEQLFAVQALPRIALGHRKGCARLGWRGNPGNTTTPNGEENGMEEEKKTLA